MVAIIKIEAVEGNPDLVYKNPYKQIVMCSSSVEQLKLSDAAANCFVLGKDETLCIHAKQVYLSVPEHDEK